MSVRTTRKYWCSKCGDTASVTFYSVEEYPAGWMEFVIFNSAGSKERGHLCATCVGVIFEGESERDA